jgi:outer membrane receptor protein involved in Fe transport
MQGLSFDHVLSPSTFYNIRLSHVLIKNDCAHNVTLRDKTPVRKFGNVWVDETPYGAIQSPGQVEVQMADGMFSTAHCAGAIDLSKVNTLNAKFDLTSQVDRYNQLKTGFILVYDDLNTHYEHVRWESMMDNWQIKWSESPYRMGAYVQDKLEFEGMIANFGVRMDYNQPNGDFFSVGDDRYSKYFKKAYKAVFLEVAPRDPAKSHIKISPRLGISHPISENAKLYFNYGHFYSMPTSDSMYRIQYGQVYQGVIYLGNPSSNLPLAE